jgi:apolipoprotein N-acyltransferase
MITSLEPDLPDLSRRRICLLAGVAVLAFHLAFAAAALSFCIVFFFLSLYSLRRVETPRKAFYVGLLVGFAMYAPQFGFFWNIFGPGAVALWLILAFWIGLFVLITHLCSRRLPAVATALLIPFLWTGIEYFRSELYYLRFSWLSVGYAFSGMPSLRHIAWIGTYGLGFVLMLITTTLLLVEKRLSLLLGTSLLIGLVALVNLPDRVSTPNKEASQTTIAGVQLEFPGPPEIKIALKKLIATFPQAEILVLSEYTLDSEVPDWLKAWCRKQQKYLIVGGKRSQPPSDFYNTAFVIAPSGEIVFEHAKSVPIQFFKDGLPARKQEVWNSPWGKIGICVCYDLSYRRVTDAFVSKGAQALIVPTRDVADGGEHQHNLHSRVAALRAAEHRIPIFRLASSGISQHVNSAGHELARAPFPGQGEFLSGTLQLSNHPRVPFDRLLAPVSVAVTLGLIVGLFVLHVRRRRVAQTRPTEPIATANSI